MSSSYNQVEETKTLAETLSLAVTTIMLLGEEMADLCATIAGRFPHKHEGIAKYQQAHAALQSLEQSHETLDDPVSRIAPSMRNLPITLYVGRQTRHNRKPSQHVRLGNAVVRLRGVVDTLKPIDVGDGDDLLIDLLGIITELEAVTFPTSYG